MVLKLLRRDDVEFEAYNVASRDFPLGGIWPIYPSPGHLWGWSIGNVYVLGDGRGNGQGGAGGRAEAMEMFARRWRIWLASAGLLELDATSREIATPPPALTLRRHDRASCEAYRVESNGVLLGTIGRTYGIDTSRWYGSLSAITVPMEERAGGMSCPCGGGADQAEALEGFTARWGAWLVTAGLLAAR